MKKEIRCTKCRSEFTNDETANISGCPECGTKLAAMAISEDVEIRINVHELRILGIWAENYAVECDLKHQDDPSYESMKLSVNTIAKEIEKQIKKQLGKYIPVTFTHELQELQNLPQVGGPVSHFRGDKELLIDEELS